MPKALRRRVAAGPVGKFPLSISEEKGRCYHSVFRLFVPGQRSFFVDLATDALFFGAAAIAGYTYLDPMLEKLGKRRQVQLYALYTRERLKRLFCL